jgi:hypothetical protein
LCRSWFCDVFLAKLIVQRRITFTLNNASLRRKLGWLGLSLNEANLVERRIPSEDKLSMGSKKGF